MIADTSISAAWSHLLAADPDLDFDTPTLPELPEDITGWVLQVRPLLKELLRESELAIQRNEQKILSLSYKKMDLELKLHNEQRRVLIDAAHDRWEMEPPEYTPANEETSKDSWKPFQNLSLGRNMHSNNLIQYNQVKVVDTVSAARNEWDSEPEPVIIPVPSSALPAFEQTAEPPKYSTETSSNTISLFGNEWGGFNVPASTVGQEREPSQTSSTDPPAIPPRRTPSVKQDTVTVNSDPWGNTQPAYTHSPQLPPRKLTSRLKSSERLSDVSHASPSSTYVTVNPYAAGKESAELFTPRIVRNVSFEEPSPAGRSEPTQPIYTQEWPTTTYEPFFKQEDVQPEIEQEPEPFPLKTSLYALQDNPWS